MSSHDAGETSLRDLLHDVLQTLPNERDMESAARELQLERVPRNVTLCLNSLSHPYQRLLAQGLRRAAAQSSSRLVVAIHADGAKDLPSLISRLAATSPDGAPDGIVLVTAVLGLSGCDPKEVRESIARLPNPPVLVSIGQELEGITSLIIDDADEIDAIVRHFVREHGYHNIGFIGGPKSNAQAERRRIGYVRAMSGLDLQPLMVQGAFDVESGEEGARQLLGVQPALEAIVCANDHMARGALLALRRLGVGAIKVSGFDDSIYSAVGEFTTVDQDPEQQGYKAFELLIRQLNGEGSGLVHNFRTRVVIGRLCGCEQTVPQATKQALARRLLATSQGSTYGRKLLRAFVTASRTGDSNEFLECLAEVAKHSQYEELRRWRRILSEFRIAVEQRAISDKRGYVALSILSEASDLLALADQRWWLDAQTRHTLAHEIGASLHRADSADSILVTAREELSRFLDTFLLIEDGHLLLSSILPRLKDDEQIEQCWPRHAAAYPIEVAPGRIATLVLDLDESLDWLSLDMLASSLGSAFSSAARFDAFRRTSQPASLRTPWNEDKKTRLSLFAAFIRESLRCDIVAIYPVVRGHSPVEEVGPAVSGELLHPEAMLSLVGSEDAVAKVLARDQTIYVNDSSEDTTLRRAGRLGFQQREQIVSVSAHVLRVMNGTEILGVMFCNYRQRINLKERAKFAERLAEHAALALLQERGDLHKR